MSNESSVPRLPSIAKVLFFVLFISLHLVSGWQVYWLGADILKGDGSSERLLVKAYYPPMRVPATPVTRHFAAEGRLAADFAQVYFPAQDKDHLANGYSAATTLDPWQRPSRYSPFLQYICSLTLCNLDYGVASLLHLCVQACLFWASSWYVFGRLGLKKYRLPFLLLVNCCLFLTPVGLAWLERGQFTLYVALCYLWLLFALVTERYRYAVLASVFAYIKWTTFPLLMVGLLVNLASAKSGDDLKKKFLLGVACACALTLPFVAFLADGMVYLRGLAEQELAFYPTGISLLLLAPKLVVKAIPFLLLALGCVGARLGTGNRLASLQPFFAGSAVVLLLYPTLAYEYSTPCLTAFIPFLLYWKETTGIGKGIAVGVVSIYAVFILAASHVFEVLAHQTLETIYTYLAAAIFFLGTFLAASLAGRALSAKRDADEGTCGL